MKLTQLMPLRESDVVAPLVAKLANARRRALTAERAFLIRQLWVAELERQLIEVLEERRKASYEKESE